MGRRWLTAMAVIAGVLAIPAAASGAGGVDRSFGENGVIGLTRTLPSGVTAYATDFAVEPKGRIYVLEEANSCGVTGCATAYDVARYLFNGDLDASYGQAGAVPLYPQGRIADIAVDGRGRPLILTGNGSDATLVRLTRGGWVDPSFGQGGSATFECACEAEHATIHVDPNGPILVRGARSTPVYASGSYANWLVLTRLTEDGGTDSRFGAGGTVAVSFGERALPNLEIRGNGSILLAGYSALSSPSIYLARVSSKGRVDRRFAHRSALDLSRLPRSTDAFGGVASVVPRGRGYFDVLGRTADGGYALRFRPNGRLDRGFGRRGLKTLDLAIEHAVKDLTGRIFAFGPAGDRAGSIAVWLSGGDRPLKRFAGGAVWLRGWSEGEFGAHSVALQRSRRPLVFDSGVEFCRFVCTPAPRMIRFTGVPGRR